MSRRVVLHTHCFIEKYGLDDEKLDRLKESLTARSKYAPYNNVEMFKETRLMVGLPRYHRASLNLIQNSVEIIDKRSEGTSIVFQLRSKPRKEQEPVIDEFMQSIANGDTGIILNARTGFGKTVVLLDFIQKIGKTTLIIVPRDFIVEQWVNRIVEHTTLTKNDIGIARQDVCQYKGKKIVVGMIHSLCKDKYPEDFKKYFGCVVWDEVHVSGADTFSQTVNLYPAKYRLAASATLARKDGMTNVYMNAMGEKVIKVEKIHKDKPTVLILPWVGIVKSLLPSYFYKVSDPVKQRGMIISAVAKDHHRTHVLCNFILRGVAKERKILVLSERTTQLREIEKRLLADGVHPRKVGVFIQSTPRNKRAEIVNRCQVILATYQIFSMAVDLSPEFSMLVMATPVSDVKQAVGRIMREMEGKKKPLIIDVVDTALKNTNGWYMARNKLWMSMEAEVYSVNRAGSIIGKIDDGRGRA